MSERAHFVRPREKYALNLGCGRDHRADMVNVDLRFGKPAAELTELGIEHIEYDLDADPGRGIRLPLPDGSVDQLLLSHVLEHLRNPLPLFDELYRVAQNGAVCSVHCPYGSSDDAWEDPTHVRALFLQSFGYFSQPYYWRADYGYRGDWKPTRIELSVPRAVAVDLTGSAEPSPNQILEFVRYQRNVVREMRATLVCVKPAREPKRELQDAPRIVIAFA